MTVEQRFEQVLVDQGVLSSAELAAWRAHRARDPSLSLEQALLAERRLSPELLDELRRQAGDDTRRDPPSTQRDSLSPETRFVAPPGSAPRLGSADSASPAFPRQIGPYRIEDLLGQGGMGAVIRVRDPRGTELALKLMRSADLDLQARFERERRLLVQLSRLDGFVPILDAGLGPHGPFLVLALMPGGSLRDRLDGRKLKIPRVVELLTALARAMGRAHDQGIVHRDLKPENILFDERGRPRISDLGLAKHFERTITGATHTASLTAQGELMGTPLYMPPEQISDARSAGPRADVYALGVIAYEALTGRVPFYGANSVEVLLQATRGQLPPLRERRPDCPPQLAALVERCLARDPQQRFADGLVLAEALAELSPDPERQRPRRLALPIAIAALALTLLALTGFRSKEPPPAPKPAAAAKPIPPRASQSDKPAPPRPQLRALALRLVGELSAEDTAPRLDGLALSPDGRRLVGHDAGGVFVRALPGGALLWRASAPGLAFQVRVSHDGARLAAGGLDLSTPMPSGWLKVWRLSGELLFSDRDESEVFQSLDFDERGALVAASGDRLNRYPPDSAEPTRSPAFGEQITAVIANPASGSFLALSFRGRAADWRGAGPLEPLRLFPAPVENLGAAGATPDRARLFLGLQRGGACELGELSVRGGIYRRLAASRLTPSHISAAADGQRIAWAQGPRQISIHDRGGLGLTADLDRPAELTSNIAALVLEPDGRHLIIGAGSGRLLRYAILEE